MKQRNGKIQGLREGLCAGMQRARSGSCQSPRVRQSRFELLGAINLDKTIIREQKD